MCLRITCARKEQCSYKKVYIMKARLVWIYSKHFFVEKWLLFYPLLLWHILFLFAKEAFKLAPLKIHFFSSFAMYLIQITAGWEGVLPLLSSLWPATCCYSRSICQGESDRHSAPRGQQENKQKLSKMQIFSSKALGKWFPKESKAGAGTNHTSFTEIVTFQYSKQIN